MIHGRLSALFDRLRPRRRVTLWHHPDYRLPVPALESAVGFDTRRADLAAWYLLDSRAVSPDWCRTPERVAYEDLARVHPLAWVASLDDPEQLSRVFQLDAGDLVPREILATARLVCGGTLGAARETLRSGEAALNLLGGFHHAAPRRAAGFCLFNDVAVAVAALRASGFAGQVAVLDFDAHPPDGTAECFSGDRTVWIGSLSGSDWGALAGVDETVLPAGCPDRPYLEALEKLLARMPQPALAFVLAGGDVLAGDRLGALGLTLDGARRRDLRVARALADVPSVWLPAGGYHPDSWRLVAGTGLALARGLRSAIPAGADPMQRRFARIAVALDRNALGRGLDLDDDMEVALGLAPRRTERLLDFYSVEGIELKLERYGLLSALRRLGYADLRVAIELTSADDILRVTGRVRGTEELLIEAALSRRRVADCEMLFVNWLTLRHPAAAFTAARPQLPGQDAPGPGLLAEMGHVLSQMAVRLGLRGVDFRPSHYHVAYVSRNQCQFIDPCRQGQFEALVRDLGHLPPAALTRAMEDREVLLDGRPYSWAPDDMAMWVIERPDADEYAEGVEAERRRRRFTLAVAG